MSFSAEQWAWNAPCPNSSAQLILAYLAFRANHKMDEASWPKIETICKATKLSHVTVRKGLKALVAAKLLTVEERFNMRGGCMTNRYILPVVVWAAPQEVQQQAEPVPKTVVPSPTDLAPTPSQDLFVEAPPSAPTPPKVGNPSPTDLGTKLTNPTNKEVSKEEAPLRGATRARSPATPEPRAKTIGQFIPDDWEPSQKDIDFATGKGMTQQQWSVTADIFKSYWQAAGGKFAKKRNWSAAWRYWVTQDIQRGGSSSPPAARRQSDFAAKSDFYKKLNAETARIMGEDTALWRPAKDEKIIEGALS